MRLGLGTETGDIKLLFGLSPNTTLLVATELLKGGFIAKKHAAPLMYGPRAVLHCPGETVRHMGFGNKGLSSCNTRTEAKVMKCSAYSLCTKRCLVLLVPLLLDLAKGEAAAFIVFYKPFE
jgi:hypothetical protein